MARYVAVPAVACLLLGIAFLARREPALDAEPALPVAMLRAEPDLEVERGPEGRRVQVSLLCAGGVSRASLRYRHEGRTGVADRTDDCGRAVAGGRADAEGPTTQVRLAGVVPEDAADVHVLLESETGNSRVPLDLP